MGTPHNCINCTCFWLSLRVNWQMTLWPNHVDSTSETPFKQMVFWMCSIENKILKRWSHGHWRSYSVDCNFVYLSPRLPLFMFQIKPKAQISSHVNNQKGRLKNSFVLWPNQKKSPNSGLWADNSLSNCIRYSFFLLPPAVKKECLITG